MNKVHKAIYDSKQHVYKCRVCGSIMASKEYIKARQEHFYDDITRLYFNCDVYCDVCGTTNYVYVKRGN